MGSCCVNTPPPAPVSRNTRRMKSRCSKANAKSARFGCSRRGAASSAAGSSARSIRSSVSATVQKSCLASFSGRAHTPSPALTPAASVRAMLPDSSSTARACPVLSRRA